MAKDDLDLVFHLGDYIYEYAAEDGHVRKHVGKETESLEDYRIRHAQYKTDPLLQAMHARCPWMVTWDDHEFDNNCANDICEVPGVDPVKFLARRANAYQAYYEMMPLRRTSLPSGPRMQLYRKISFGRLAEFLVCDTRQYRTDQPTGDELGEINDAAFSPTGTLLGPRQFAWVQSSLAQSPARWNVLAQQVSMALIGIPTNGIPRYYMDGWSGYAYERQKLLQFLETRRVSNPVVLTGDYHSNQVNNLRVDDREEKQPVVATEIVGTSISSAGNGSDKPDDWQAIIDHNPCVQFYNNERGYVRCTLTPDALRSDFRVVDDITRPDGKVTTRASYVVENGRPGAEQA
jgi:alkaline phosphatase D